MYTPYADVKFYINDFKGEKLNEKSAKKYLISASRHIDVLTYNRVVRDGIAVLPQWQQDIIRIVCCRQAEFECENRDIISDFMSDEYLTGMTLMNGERNLNIIVIQGIATKKEVYALLEQTGLCKMTTR